MWSQEAALLQTLHAHRSDVNSLDLHHGPVLATASSDKTVRLWTWSSGLGFVETEHSPARGHKFGVVCVRFSPQGTMVASCGIDGTARVWCRRSLRCLRTLPQPGGAGVRALQWAAATRLATGADDGSLCVWDVPRAHLLRRLPAHEGSLQALSVCCEGALLVSACTWGVLKLYDVHELCSSDEEEAVSALRWVDDAHDQGVLCADAARGEGCAGGWWRVGTGGQDGRVRVWRVERAARKAGEAVGAPSVELQALQTLDGHGSAVTCVRWAAAGVLASGSVDRSVRVWDASALPALCLRVIDAHARYINALAFSPDRRLLITGSNDKSARVWTLAGVDLDATLQPPCSVLSHFGVGDLQGIGPLCGDLGEGSEAGAGELELGAGGARCMWRDRTAHCGAINSIAAHADLVATACSDRVVRVWGAREGGELHLVHELAAHRYPATAVEFTGGGGAGGAALVSVGLDGLAVLWDVQSGCRVRSVSTEVCGGGGCGAGGGGGARGARVSRGEEPLLLVASDDQVAPVWRLTDTTPEPLHVYADHGDAVVCCAWSRDGALAVTGGAGGELRVHAAPPSPALLHHEPNAHDLGVQSCDFASSAAALGAVDEDGLHLLATAGCDSLAKLWAVRVYKGDAEAAMTTQVRVCRVLRGHGGTVTCCRFSLRADLLATAATDQHVRVWTSVSGRCVCALSLGAGVASCSWLGGGARLLVAGTLDAELSLWSLPPPTLEEEVGVVCEGIPCGETCGEAGESCGGEARRWSPQRVLSWLRENVTRAPDSDVTADIESVLLSRVVDLHIDGVRLIESPLEELLADFGFSEEMVTTVTEDAAESWEEARATGETGEVVEGQEVGEGRLRAVCRSLVEEVRWVRARPLLSDLSLCEEVEAETPHQLLCPITHRLMLEPVKCADGFTYERAAILEWFLAAGAAVSPLTGRALLNAHVSTNHRAQRSVRRLLCSRLAVPTTNTADTSNSTETD